MVVIVPPVSGIDVEVRATGVVVTRMTGRVAQEDADRALEPFQRALNSAPHPRWIIDQLKLTGFSPAAVTAGARWFQAFKQAGGQHVMVVSTLPAARMAASSLAFATRLSIVTFDSMQDALLHAARVGASVLVPPS